MNPQTILSITKNSQKVVDSLDTKSLNEFFKFLDMYNRSILDPYFIFKKKINLPVGKERFIYQILQEQVTEIGVLDTYPLKLSITSILLERNRLTEYIKSIDFVLSGSEVKKTQNTQSVIFDMISKAQHEIIVLSYLYIKTAKVIIDALKVAGERGVKLMFLGEEENLMRIAKGWEKKETQLPQYFVYDPKDSHQTMHAKIALVDRSDLLITSANLTQSGLKSNTEFGVRIRGNICSQAYDLIQSLIEKELFTPFFP